jgi:hypothetical protein
VGEEEFEVPTSSLSVFPNPATERITLTTELGQTQTVSITITDINGRLVFEKRSQSSGLLSEEIDVSGFNQGVYLLHLTVDGKKESRKIMVQ